MLLNNPEKKKEIASRFGLQITEDGHFESSNEENVERIIKILCNRAALDPIEENPVAILGMRKWK